MWESLFSIQWVKVNSVLLIYGTFLAQKYLLVIIAIFLTLMPCTTGLYKSTGRVIAVTMASALVSALVLALVSAPASA